jgi:hypothetical protein
MILKFIPEYQINSEIRTDNWNSEIAYYLPKNIPANALTGEPGNIRE